MGQPTNHSSLFIFSSSLPFASLSNRRLISYVYCQKHSNSAEISHNKSVTNAGVFIWRNISAAWSHCCSDCGCVIGPKDLPMIARTAGRLAGRAIGYVQLARGQFETVVQQSQARQVHKELQDTMAQLDAIRHEIRSISIINPGPLTRRLVDNLDHTSISNDNRKPEDVEENDSIPTVTKDSTSLASNSCNMQSKATTYARLAESPAIKNGLSSTSTEVEKIKDELQLTVLPVSAENTGLLPNRGADVKGSDIVLEAILEAEVAHNAKEFFSQPQNQI